MDDVPDPDEFPSYLVSGDGPPHAWRFVIKVSPHKTPGAWGAGYEPMTIGMQLICMIKKCWEVGSGVWNPMSNQTSALFRDNYLSMDGMPNHRSQMVCRLRYWVRFLDISQSRYFTAQTGLFASSCFSRTF